MGLNGGGGEKVREGEGGGKEAARLGRTKRTWRE